MRVTRLDWVDVFATAPFRGNPLAVVRDAECWDPARMQALATELGLSETAYVVPATAPGADARLRIFTPTRELPMAGHPVVGAAWVLHRDGQIGPRAVIETGAGPLAVEADAAGARMTQAPPAAGPRVDAAEVARACRVTAAGPQAEVWSTGLDQLMLRVPDVAALARARPDLPALVRLGERDGWVGVSLYALTEPQAGRLGARVRHFTPRLGVAEDPFTGSAAGALGACLAAAAGTDGLLRLTVVQGAELGRPGEAEVLVDARAGRPWRVRVGGSVVAVMAGRLQFPGAAVGGGTGDDG